MSLIYAQTHPERAKHLVLRGVFLMTQAELDWFYGGGAGRFWPDVWKRFVDLERFPDQLDIRHEMPCGVRFDRSGGPRPTAAPLIKQDHAIHFGIEIAPHGGAASAPRTAVQNQNRDAVRVSALFDIDRMAITDIEHPLVKGSQAWI